MPEQSCPCGLPESYEACCGRLHSGAAHAPTAEALMRSRYTAFVVGDAAYLLATWDPATRPRRVDVSGGSGWTGLEIVARTGGGLVEPTGTVAFRAGHVDGVVAENSAFRRADGRWVYVGEA